MIKKIATLLFIITLSSCSDDPRLQPLSADATILAFGDSLTYGTGADRNNAYPAVLENLVSRRVINAGIPGEVTSKGLTRLPALIEKYAPELIIICHGGNDILRKLDMSRASANIQKMITLAKQQNTQVVLVGVPEFGLFLTSSPIYEALAERNQVPIANNILGDILAKLNLKSDRIHPNAQGYQLLAERIAALLKENGALPET